MSKTNPPTISETIVIRPPDGSFSLGLKDVFQYRELIYFLSIRNIKIRYKQTILGASWAIIQPFFTMVVFSLFFGNLAGVPSDGIEYPLFSYAALVPWTFFANSMIQSSQSLVGNANLITKVYFPRLAIPLSTVLSGIIDFILAFVVLLGMMVFFGQSPTINVIFLPYFFLLTWVTTTGVGIWLAAMNVQFRDVRYAIPFFVQFWLFSTPIAYSSSLLSEPWRTLYGLNPMVGVVEGFRWALLGTDTAPGPIIIASSIVSLLIFVSGLWYFNKMEKSFADIV